MQIEKKDRRNAGSCNFCKSGKVHSSGDFITFNYNYDEVYQMSGAGLIANICPDCAETLKYFIILDDVK